MATLDQKRASLDAGDDAEGRAHRRRQRLSSRSSGARKHVMGYMKDFLFGPEQARTPIGRLSRAASAAG